MCLYVCVCGGGLAPLQRSSQCILQPQLTGQWPVRGQKEDTEEEKIDNNSGEWFMRIGQPISVVF